MNNGEWFRRTRHGLDCKARGGSCQIRVHPTPRWQGPLLRGSKLVAMVKMAGGPPVATPVAGELLVAAEIRVNDQENAWLKHVCRILGVVALVVGTSLAALVPDGGLPGVLVVAAAIALLVGNEVWFARQKAAERRVVDTGDGFRWLGGPEEIEVRDRDIVAIRIKRTPKFSAGILKGVVRCFETWTADSQKPLRMVNRIARQRRRSLGRPDRPPDRGLEATDCRRAGWRRRVGRRGLAIGRNAVVSRPRASRGNPALYRHRQGRGLRRQDLPLAAGAGRTVREDQSGFQECRRCWLR